VEGFFMDKAKKRGKGYSQNKSYILETVKALIIALIISLVLVLIMSLFMKWFSIPTSATGAINQVIKGVSILAAALLAFKLPRNGWLRGILFGILYTILAFLVFSILDDLPFSIGLSLLNDIAMGAVSGLISGIIAVNLRKPKL
jgi:putative membrane protein (TIGR04086 family)